MLVYIAGPYSAKTPEAVMDNVNNAIWVGEDVASIPGCIPFIPHLFHWWDGLVGGKPYDFWMNIDKEYLLRCDVVLRMPGISPGADSEAMLAIENEIPVVQSIDELRQHVSGLYPDRISA